MGQKYFSLGVFATFWVLLEFTHPVYAGLCSSIEEPPTQEEVDAGFYYDRLVIRFRNGQAPRSDGRIPNEELQKEIASADIKSLRRAVALNKNHELQNFYVLKLNTKNLSALNGLRQKVLNYANAIRSVEYEAIVQNADLIPNDENFSEQWSLLNTGQDIPSSGPGLAGADIDMIGAWDLLHWLGYYRKNSPQMTAQKLGKPKEDFKVAVIDSGVNPHSEIKNVLLNGWNFYSDNADTSDDLGHGTHVSGIIAAQENNYEGVAGIASQLKILPVKILCGGMGGASHLAAGIVYAADEGAAIANMSLQFYYTSSLVIEAIEYAVESDLLLIAASGNNHGADVAYPAKYDYVYGVGATNNLDNWASFSNYGTEVDVSAPGQDVLSLDRKDLSYAYLSGTSMATPMIVAAAALLKQNFSFKTNEDVMNHLFKTSVDLGPTGWDQKFGHGRLDLYTSLRSAISCPADLNQDGQLNVLDFAAFQQFALVQHRIADFDWNREIDYFDYMAFVDEFSKGCI